VLICPGCQASFDWTADLDRCPVCSSVHLLRRLGEAECRDCGSVHQPAAASHSGVSQPEGAAPGKTGRDGTARDEAGRDGPGRDEAGQGLALEVERALARVLGRTAGSPACSPGRSGASH
jgi:hypothetical protein